MSILASSRRLLRLLRLPTTKPFSSDSKPIHPRIHLPPLIPSNRDSLKGFSIELVDPDLWRVSFGPSQSLHQPTTPPQAPPEQVLTNHIPVPDDFDEIDSLRLQKKLFYKLDRGSIEFDECNVNFHRTKSSKRIREKRGDNKRKMVKVKTKHNGKLVSEKVKPGKPAKAVKQKSEAAVSSRQREVEDWGSTEEMDLIGRGEVAVMVTEGKKARVPTFNQVTDPYHLPFCLDIYITKGSVRACIVHRVTSKVVAVAHSISKDMKLDLKSRKDSATCDAVGKILAQRAIEDDIHNVIYTPRKGDKIEGKLQIVLQSIIDHGIDVKVKLKQKKLVKDPRTGTQVGRGQRQSTLYFVDFLNAPLANTTISPSQLMASTSSLVV